MVDRLTNIASRFEPKIKSALLRAFDAIKKEVNLNELETIMTTGGIPAVVHLLSTINIESIIEKEIIDDINNAIIDSGRQTVHVIPPGTFTETVFYYNILNPVTSDFIRSYELSLIQKIGSNTREAIRNAIEADYLAGNNPRSTARVFKDTIGLTPTQELAIRNYKKGLEELDPNVLSRKLRDKRFDSTVKRAVSTKNNLTTVQIDNMVDKYRQRYLSFRATTIARTESLRAVSIGEYTSVLQAVNNGSVDATNVRRFWVYTNDPKTRNEHRQIPGLNPNGVLVDQPFVTPYGPLLFPRDPSGSAANTIQCRCTVVYRIIN
jgi:hypothetical protein